MGSDTVCRNLLVPSVSSQELFPSPLPSGPLPAPEMAACILPWSRAGGRGGAVSLLSKPEPCLTPTVLSGTVCLQSILYPPHLFPFLVSYELLSALTNQKMPLVLHFKFTLSFRLAINLLNAFIPQKKFPPLTYIFFLLAISILSAKLLCLSFVFPPLFFLKPKCY